MADLRSLKERIRAAVAERSYLEKQISEASERKRELENRHQASLLAKELIIQVAQKTQANIGSRISDLVSLALDAVFDDAYKFQIDFVQRRGVTEADLWFVRDGNSVDPMNASGGGAIDIASFALRLAVWTLCKTRPLFILDEPFRNLSLDLQNKAGLMLKELSGKLGIQIIMVSHNPEIISGADKVFRIGQD